MILPPLLLATLIASTCFITFAFGATLLPNDEVEALWEIGRTLGKNWDFGVDPCGGDSGWVTQKPVKGSENNVTCDCSFSDSTVCHVVSIVLKSQNLPGVLPPKLGKLPYLQNIDFTRNYLSGPIPPEWGSTKLVNISLLGNRLTGSIPKELGNITTLLHLTVEFNHLSGALPPELGNLPLVEDLFLSSNNFTGELPPTFARLTTLKDFRISDNHFTGKIPNFIENWTNLEKLLIQASGLDGPIPSGIASLINLSDLRISDLNGSEVRLPRLSNLKNLKTLILRSCNITGKLPDYDLGNLSRTLKTLDLSFNKLSGNIPTSFEDFKDVDFMYLTGNLLNGTIPRWMLEVGGNIDLSYNNFTLQNSGECHERLVNFFGSSLESNNSGFVSCLMGTPCQKTWYSFHINCGGKKVIDGKTIYDEDKDPAGSSKFIKSETNWAFSSTGDFLDDGINPDNYILTSSNMSMNTSQELYMDARLSPLSLTYYGFCLGNGNYTVNLHFAEIKFTDDKTFSSLGRRIFDVYVQRKLVLKDFNIEDEAGGVGKEIIKTIHAVVTSNMLEIRFYWAGKGTTAIPDRGVYGPLISAISVKSEFKPPSENGSISAGTVVGIVAAVTFAIFLILGTLWWKNRLRHKDRMEHDLRGLELQTGSFTLRQIKAATNNFDVANKIGEGGFGSVYKGFLSDGTIIAVKQLSSKSKQGNREFVNEIGMISAVQHPHLVKLYGCCIEGNQLLLVYEYMENNSLARALFGPEESRLELDWPTRRKICIGIARGLAYLHEESRLKIVHRDIKATNVLLDENLNPKISDFGLAKLDEEENTHISTRIAGTYGYMAPEYAMRGYLTDKADVYSFGIVALEIVSGRSNIGYKPKDENFNLLDWALVLKDNGSLMELVDPRLGSDFNKEEMTVMINVALLCTNVSPAVRPAMSSVVSMLEGRAVVQELVSDPSATIDEMKLKAIRNQHQHSQEGDMSDSLIKSMSNDAVKSMSNDGPWTTSSTSGPDLYPINLDSHYLESRD